MRCVCSTSERITNLCTIIVIVGFPGLPRERWKTYFDGKRTGVESLREFVLAVRPGFASKICYSVVANSKFYHLIRVFEILNFVNPKKTGGGGAG